MRLVLQRVKSASVRVDGETVGSIGQGVLALVGLGTGDDAAAAAWALKRILGIRLWEDAAGKAWARSVAQEGFEVLLVSQFTLHAVLKGNKPDFHHAMPPAPPSLWIYSLNDEILDIPSIEKMIAKWRARGDDVQTLVLDESPHVKNLLTAPDAYYDAVRERVGDFRSNSKS